MSHGRLLLVVTLLIEIVTVVFLLCVFWGTITIMKSSYDMKATALQISMSYFYLGLLIGSFGMLVYLFEGMIRNIKGLFTG